MLKDMKAYAHLKPGQKGTMRLFRFQIKDDIKAARIEATRRTC
jgi:hypothetical protein